MMDFRSIVACASLLIATLGPAAAAAEDKITVVRTFSGPPPSGPGSLLLPPWTLSHRLCVNGATEFLAPQMPAQPTKKPEKGYPPPQVGSLDYGKFCLPLPPSALSPSGLSSVLQEIHAIRMPGRVDALTAAVKSHVAAAEARNAFFENQMIAELQARMDRWPAELLADRVAYEAFRDQIMVDLQDIVEAEEMDPEQ